MIRFARILIRLYVRVCRALFGVNRNKVVFESFDGKSYSDNPRAVSEALRVLAPKMDIVWPLSDPASKKGIVPSNVRIIDRNAKWKYYKELATCGCYVTNFKLPNLSKGKKQRFVQLWHGDRAFKKVLYDSSFAPSDFFLCESKNGYCDLAVAGSDYGEMQYRSAFRYNGEIVKVGTPRNDILLNHTEDKIKSIKDCLNISGDKMIVLYAPTLRRKNANDRSLQPKQDIDLESTLSKLNDATGKDWLLLVRAHPAVSGMGGLTVNEKIIDVSNYEDMADLLLISDFLITDYSSSAGDYALLHRPIVLFQSDYDEYVKKDRGFYFDMKDSPYYIAENQEDLEKIIANITHDAVVANCDKILEFYGTNETGKASEVVANRIIEWMK